MAGLGLDNRSTTPDNMEEQVHRFRMLNDKEYAGKVNFANETANQGMQDTSLDFLPGAGIGESIAGAGLGAVASRGVGRAVTRGAKDILPGYKDAKLADRGQRKRADAIVYNDFVAGLDDAGLEAEYAKVLKDKPSYELTGSERDKYMALELASEARDAKKGIYYDEAPEMYEDAWDYTSKDTGKKYSDGMSREEFLEMDDEIFADQWARAGYPSITDEAVDSIQSGKATLDDVLKDKKNLVDR